MVACLAVIVAMFSLPPSFPPPLFSVVSPSAFFVRESARNFSDCEGEGEGETEIETNA